MLQSTITVALLFLQISLTCAAITPDPQCGTNVSCYPPTCPESGCTDFHLSWEDAGEYIRFRMVSAVVAPATDVWAAIAFSKDKLMKDSSVVMCKVNPESVEIGYNEQLKYSYITVKTETVLRNVSVSRNGTYMTCVFSRMKIPTEQPTQIFALNETPLYLLHALGVVEGGIPGYHGANKQASSSPLIFVNVTGTTATIPTSPSTTMAPPSTTSSAITLKTTFSSMFLTCLTVVVTLL